MSEQRYVAFLRAVNVGGRTVAMARLREVLAGLGCDVVRTYLNSGNAFFTAPEADRGELTARVEAALGETFGFAVPAVLRTLPELRADLAAAPFGGREPAEDERFSLVFAKGELNGGGLPLRSRDWEVLGARGGTLFVVWRLRNGRATNPVPEVEKHFGVQATGRFFHTTRKILAAAEKE